MLLTPKEYQGVFREIVASVETIEEAIEILTKSWLREWVEGRLTVVEVIPLKVTTAA